MAATHGIPCHATPCKTPPGPKASRLSLRSRRAASGGPPEAWRASRRSSEPTLNSPGRRPRGPGDSCLRASGAGPLAFLTGSAAGGGAAAQAAERDRSGLSSPGSSQDISGAFAKRIATPLREGHTLAAPEPSPEIKRHLSDPSLTGSRLHPKGESSDSPPNGSNAAASASASAAAAAAAAATSAHLLTAFADWPSDNSFIRRQRELGDSGPTHPSPVKRSGPPTPPYLSVGPHGYTSPLPGELPPASPAIERRRSVSGLDPSMGRPPPHRSPPLPSAALQSAALSELRLLTPPPRQPAPPNPHRLYPRLLILTS